ncbi:helicase [Paenibacillus sp. alder61]|uniref:helicase-related protein n=1 Tax=Paenibacillus sp. alder61 TaxID=2862948 RepID=UPI001CD24D9F|nr:helicase-related protein [Paenibacillus sp. alder61]MCA1292221.1 helicase [Paenibacillus sp. alder61]
MEELLTTRTQLINELRKEILGPGSEYSIPYEDYEIITDLPETRYSVGVLFPQKNLINAENSNEFVPKIPKQFEIDQDNDIPVIPVFDEDIKEEQSYFGNVADESDNSLDEDISLSMQNMPSSMGITFFVESHVKEMIVNISFGTYRNAVLEDCKIPFYPEGGDQYVLPNKVNFLVEYDRDNKLLILKNRLTPKEVTQIKQSEEIHDEYLIDCLYRLSDQFTKGFVRVPHSLPVTIDFSDNGYFETNKLDNEEIKCVALRKVTPDGIQAITILLVNMNTGGYNGTNSFFQPKILIDSKINKGLKFECYSNREYSDNGDLEEKGLDLLYRNKKVYATGHGVSTDWKVTDTGEGEIWSDFMPIYEVPQMDFNIKDTRVDSSTFSMKFLSDLDKTEKSKKISLMKNLVEAYSSWITEIEKTGLSLDKRYREAVIHHIKECRESCERMYYGLELLGKSDAVYNAFQLANRAMFMQRIHSAFQREDHYPNDEKLHNKLTELNYYNEDDKNHKWRPFQLAFLLMSLRSIVEENCSERDLIDLIWFPTGGGKTEAYLGLTAFTIFYRRLIHLSSSAGTTVIMRYTLRLLAAQQFLRASTLICACESIRKDCYGNKSQYPMYKLGNEKITIGLWIGGSHTPNKNEDAKKCLNELLKANSSNLREVKDKHNKFQLLKCPWCGTKLVKDHDKTGKNLIGSWGYLMKDKKRFLMFCPQEGCEFEATLPIQVVDEELYENPPTLLFGTVDKFAMLPWKSNAGSFFASTDKNRTPELIIQDELHLISGPLGTMVGLYETAIDALNSAKGVRPKIIASTATIRRAKDQCSNLFNRDVKQFPSPGINSDDSFFAREANIKEKPGRIYIGIMPSGKTKAMMEVRSIAAILQRVHMMNVPYEVKDKYWTLAVYFNSLRDLSKCSTLVDDDVKDFIRRTAQRFGNRKLARPTGAAYELTSRISTSQLNETLEKLEQVVYSEENQKDKKYPINVLLATNMISVGVDVARLNIMLLVGQPKLTSEYIQASSRIGRTHPGAAFVLYDGAKSRDRSHYEQFRSYHESFYKFVEPTGATPFSKPARDRALHAVMVTLMRHKYNLTSDNAAAYFQRDDKAINEIEEFIISRVNEIRSRAEIHLRDESSVIFEEMEEFWDEWEDRISRSVGNNFYYGDRYLLQDPPSDTKRLLKAFGNNSSDFAKETLTSMRNVDKNVTAGLIIWE